MQDIVADRVYIRVALTIDKVHIKALDYRQICTAVTEPVCVCVCVGGGVYITVWFNCDYFLSIESVDYK